MAGQVAFKSRDHYIQQIQGMSQFVQRQIEVKDEATGVTSVQQQYDVGLASNLHAVELLLDIRDILLNLAASQGALKPTAGSGALYLP